MRKESSAEGSFAGGEMGAPQEVDRLPFNPSAFSLDHLKSAQQPVMHTLAPIHHQPPKVLQDMQDALQEQALFSPVYTRSGFRPHQASNCDGQPRHEKREIDNAPELLVLNSAAAPRPQTRAGPSNLPHLLPPHSLSPPERISSRLPKQRSSTQGDLAQQASESPFDLISRGRDVAGAQDAAEEAVLVFPDYDYDWVTKTPERQQRWLNHHKSVLCRLLNVDGRRIQGGLLLQFFCRSSTTSSDRRLLSGNVSLEQD